MFDYLLTASLLSMFSLTSCYFLKTAPARTRFYVLVVGLLSWLIPWQQLSPPPFLIDLKLYTIEVSSISDSGSIPPNSIKQTTLQTESNWLSGYTINQVFSNLFVFLTVVGGGLLLARVWSYKRLLSGIEKGAYISEEHQYLHSFCTVKFTELSTPAITTGPIQHTIWLDFKMKGRPELESVIEHELTHIKHKDTYWLWLICATESIFFWNPFCLLLANLARQQIELSCDESCMEKLSDKYRYDLASLLLSEHQYRYEHASLGHSVLAVSHSKSFNIQRVKTLNKEKKMKLSHLMIITAALSCSALAANQIVSEKQVTQGASKQKSEKSARYQQQLRELLAGAKGAKSNDETQLKAAVSHILNWHSNRGSLNGFEELDIKVKSFTLLDQTYHKLGQYEAILTAYNNWFPEGSTQPPFLKNRLASAYMHLGQHQKAAEQLESLSEKMQSRFQIGSATDLARAYIEMADYDKALAVLNSDVVTSAENQAYQDILRYYAYEKLNNQTKVNELKERLPADYAKTPAILPRLPRPGSLLLAKL
ncbi:M56 family metallopeptidase [Pseudoalteromonas piscicida]|uniref:M56 family metallopeptidase n=1 Tax=Pseudoalteromonas piscicida TaxID=43662 RepID=UPI0032BFB3C3